jgi:hypothetical protein
MLTSNPLDDLFNNGQNTANPNDQGNPLETSPYEPWRFCVFGDLIESVRHAGKQSH